MLAIVLLIIGLILIYTAITDKVGRAWTAVRG